MSIQFNSICLMSSLKLSSSLSHLSMDALFNHKRYIKKIETWMPFCFRIYILLLICDKSKGLEFVAVFYQCWSCSCIYNYTFGGTLCSVLIVSWDRKGWLASINIC